MSGTKPYAVDVMIKEAVVLADADTNYLEAHGRATVQWLSARLLDVLGKGAVEPAELDVAEAWSKFRYCSDLDTFEFMGVMIPRAQVHAIAVMMLRGLDDAEQMNHVCESCKQQRGFFIERGFRRCKSCGYPGQ